VVGAATGGCLVGHGADPLDQAFLEQATHAHQQDGVGAVATDVVLHALGQCVLDDVAVDRVQHDHGIILHAQRGGGVDPVAVPAGCTQLGEDLVGVVATLCGNDDVAFLQLIDAVGVFERRCRFGKRRRFAARIRSREKYRFDVIEITLVLHALHQDRTHHSTPANQTNQFHHLSLFMNFHNQ